MTDALRLRLWWCCCLTVWFLRAKYLGMLQFDDTDRYLKILHMYMLGAIERENGWHASSLVVIHVIMDSQAERIV